MAQTEQLSPVRLLLELESRSRAHAAELPQKLEMLEMWNGIAFRIGETNMIASMDEVTEILHMPGLTRIPNSKAWVLGIANIRGNLLPVMDLNGFLYGNNSKTSKRSRILVLNHNKVFSGLVVDEVYGMRHFEKNSWEKKLPKHDAQLTPFIERSYRTHDSNVWLVFGMHKLAETQLFMQAGL